MATPWQWFVVLILICCCSEAHSSTWTLRRTAMEDQGRTAGQPQTATIFPDEATPSPPNPHAAMEPTASPNATDVTTPSNATDSHTTPPNATHVYTSSPNTTHAHTTPNTTEVYTTSPNATHVNTQTPNATHIYTTPPNTTHIYPTPNTTHIYPTPNTTYIYPTPNTTHIYPTPNTTYIYPTPNTTYINPTPNTTHMYPTPNTTDIYTTPNTTHIYPTPNTTYINPTPNTTYINPTPNTTHIYPTPNTTDIYTTPNTTHIYPTPNTTHIYPTPSTTHIYPTPSTTHQNTPSAPSDTTPSPTTHIHPTLTTIPTPISGTWYVNQSGEPCIILQAAITVNITYSTSPSTASAVLIHLPESAESRGACGQNSSYITLGLRSGDFNLTFTFDANVTLSGQENANFVLSQVGLEYVLDEGMFPDATASGKAVLVQYSSNSSNDAQIAASMGSSLKCDAEQSFNLDRHHVLSISHVQVQPFSVKDGKFSKPETCPGDDQGSQYNPGVAIALGVTMPIVFVLVFVGWHYFCVMRKRGGSKAYSALI